MKTYIEYANYLLYYVKVILNAYNVKSIIIIIIIIIIISEHKCSKSNFKKKTLLAGHFGHRDLTPLSHYNSNYEMMFMGTSNHNLAQLIRNKAIARKNVYAIVKLQTRTYLNYILGQILDI